MGDKPRILIVDDDPLVRSALSRLCQSVGYDALSYESAEAFLAAERRSQNGCLVLDVHLPGQSGLQLQSAMQAAKDSIPIVFISAHEDEQAKSRALDQGAVGFLRKPLDSQRLLDVIARTLAAGEA